MNCQEFKENISAIARGRTPQSAAQHAAQCSACAAQLLQMQSLHKGLTALREADAQRGAALATENALRAAFQAQHAPAASRQPPESGQWSVAGGQSQPSRQPVRGRWLEQVARAKVWTSGLSRVWWMRGAALAAGLALCVTVYGIWHNNVSTAPNSTAATVTALPPAPQGIVLPEIQVSAAVSRESSGASVPTARAQVRRSPARAQAVTQTAKLTRPAVAANAQPKKAAPPEVFTNHPREVVTEYFSLNNAPTLQPTDEVNIVRVKLPRSAMAAFGLPVNENRATEQVTADVVIGADGMARAIRFVR